MALPLFTIYTLSKLLYTLKYKKGRGLMDIKIDMKKTFDKIEWAFILGISAPSG